MKSKSKIKKIKIYVYAYTQIFYWGKVHISKWTILTSTIWLH